jgi:hypothetical protein
VLVYEDTTAVVASRAYQLAETGRFKDFAAIERELLAEGFGREIEGLKKSPLENALNATCLSASSAEFKSGKMNSAR